MVWKCIRIQAGVAGEYLLLVRLEGDTEDDDDDVGRWFVPPTDFVEDVRPCV